MKKMTLAYIDSYLKEDTPSVFRLLLNDIVAEQIDIATWHNEYPYKPHANFKLAYCRDGFLLNFNVKEKQIRAVNNTPNGSVWEDSCVEFFVSFDDCKTYYNLEFNAIGICLLGFGEGRNNRELLPDSLIQNIKYEVFIKKSSAEYEWSLLLFIPFHVYKYHTIEPKKGDNFRANFYKCGDKLPEPHFLSWSPITFPKPNFHLPEFFGTITF